jgi:hypothetical protein
MSTRINAIERNGSDCTYVEIFTHEVGSIGAPSRRTVFITGTIIIQFDSLYTLRNIRLPLYRSDYILVKQTAASKRD